MRHLIAPLAAAALLAAGCNSAPSHPLTPPVWPPSVPPVASATNALADLPQDLSKLPGDRNYWDLDRDFAIAQGSDEGQLAGAVQLSVGIPASTPLPNELPSDFVDLDLMPYDLVQADLSFTSPVVTRGAAQLAAVAAVPGFASGNTLVLAGSLGLPATGGNAVPTRLSQAIDLTSVAAGTNLLLGWSHQVVLRDGTIAGPAAPAWRVQVRITGGATLAVYSSSTSVPYGSVSSLDVSAAAGQRISLDFELLGSPRSFAAIDDVTLVEGATNHVVNGDFSTGLGSWTVSGADQPCQVVAAPRTVGGLKVVRQFMARPENRWGRYLDTFENTGATTVTTQANYVHVLGAATEAVIQSSAGGKAVSSWDASGLSPALRDLAVVFGASSLAPVYQSTTVPVAGSPYVWTRFPLTLAPGQKKVVVQFVVLTTDRTGDTAVDLTARASSADQEAAAIVAGFWSDADYREGMTPEQEAALVNF